MSHPSAPPPGWYFDPDDRQGPADESTRERWWTGEAWSEHVRMRSAASAPWPAAPERPDRRPADLAELLGLPLALKRELVVATDRSQLWAVAADVRRMPEWMPGVVSADVLSGEG